MAAKNIAKAIKARREAIGISQTEAAKRTGISQGRWSGIESGEKSNLRVETLRRIAKGLGCTVGELVDD